MNLQKLFCSEAACLKINPGKFALLSSNPKITHALNDACRYLVILPCLYKIMVKKSIRLDCKKRKKEKTKLKKTKQIHYKHYVYRLDRQMDTLRLLM